MRKFNFPIALSQYGTVYQIICCCVRHCQTADSEAGHWLPLKVNLVMDKDPSKVIDVFATQGSVKRRLDCLLWINAGFPKLQMNIWYVLIAVNIDMLRDRSLVVLPRTCHITPLLASLHWLKIKERIEYKLLSLTYKILTTSQATYLHNLVSLQSSRGTRSSSIDTLSRPESRNARNLVSWFSGKLLKLLPPDVRF